MERKYEDLMLQPCEYVIVVCHCHDRQEHRLFIVAVPCKQRVVLEIVFKILNLFGCLPNKMTLKNGS
jgi:hypothetical protein